MFIGMGLGLASGFRGVISSLIADRATVSADRAEVVGVERVFIEVQGLSEWELANYRITHDFGDTGDFQSLPAGHRWLSKNIAMGHNAFHAYTDTSYGTRTIITTIENLTERFVIATEVTHTDPDTYFGAANTWVVDPNGLWTGAPSGNQVTTYDDARDAVMANDRFGRIILKNAETYTIGTNKGQLKAASDDGAGYWYVDTYGAGAKAKFTIEHQAFTADDGVEGLFNVVFHAVEGEGLYDPETGLYSDASPPGVVFFTLQDQANVTMCEVTTSKCQSSYSISNSTDFAICGAETGQSVALFDCVEVDGHENYGMFAQTLHRGGMRGCRFQQSLLAVNGTEAKDLTGPVNYPDHACIRVAHGKSICLSQNQFFTDNGWSGGTGDYGGSTIMHHQPVTRIFATYAINGSLNAWANDCEGTLNIGASSGIGVMAKVFANVHGNYILMTANSIDAIKLSAMGVWVHDNVMVIPNTPPEQYGAAKYRGFLGYSTHPVGSGPIDTALFSEKTYIYRNTMVDLRSIANANGETVEQMFDTADFEADGFVVGEHLIMDDNIINVSRISEDTGNPLTTTEIYTGLYTGMRFKPAAAALIVDTSFATPAGSGVEARHDAASGVNRSSGAVSYTPVSDFYGDHRGDVTALGAYAYRSPLVSFTNAGLTSSGNYGTSAENLVIFVSFTYQDTAKSDRVFEIDGSIGRTFISINPAGEIACQVSDNAIGSSNVVTSGLALVAGDSVRVLSVYDATSGLSMAVSKDGGAWVEYTDGGVASVDLSGPVGLFSIDSGGNYITADVERILVAHNVTTLPDYSDADHMRYLIASTGEGAEPLAVDMLLGVQPHIDFNGAASRWNAGEHDGTMTGFSVANGTITDA